MHNTRQELAVLKEKVEAAESAGIGIDLSPYRLGLLVKDIEHGYDLEVQLANLAHVASARREAVKSAERRAKANEVAASTKRDAQTRMLDWRQRCLEAEADRDKFRAGLRELQIQMESFDRMALDGVSMVTVLGWLADIIDPLLGELTNEELQAKLEKRATETG